MNLFLTLHEAINKPFSLYLNSFTDNVIIAKIIYLFADAPIFFLPLFLVGYWLYFNYKKEHQNKNILLFIFYSTLIAVIFSIFIQNLVHIDRPEDSLHHAGKMILSHIPDASFPSDHASVSSEFLMSLFLFWFIRIWLILLPFMVVMLFSRIAGWVHWPLDIVAGICIGCFSSFLVYKSQNINILVKINMYILKFTSYFKL